MVKESLYRRKTWGVESHTSKQLLTSLGTVTFRKTVTKRTYEAAVELFVYLCKKYGLDPMADGVIISYRERHSRGIASNHGDSEHLWNQLGVGYTMNTFRATVKKAMGGDGSGSSSDSGSSSGKGLQVTAFKDLMEA